MELFVKSLSAHSCTSLKYSLLNQAHLSPKRGGLSRNSQKNFQVPPYNQAHKSRKVHGLRQTFYYPSI